MVWEGWKKDWLGHARGMQLVADRIAPQWYVIDVVAPWPGRSGQLVGSVVFRIPILGSRFAEIRAEATQSLVDRIATVVFGS